MKINWCPPDQIEIDFLTTCTLTLNKKDQSVATWVFLCRPAGRITSLLPTAEAYFRLCSCRASVGVIIRAHASHSAVVI